MQCSAVQCSAVQCSTVQRSAVQYSAVQCSAVQYSTVQHSTAQYSTVQCSAVQCSTVLYCTVQCSAVQCSAVQYSTEQYSTVQYIWFKTSFLVLKLHKQIFITPCECNSFLNHAKIQAVSLAFCTEGQVRAHASQCWIFRGKRWHILIIIIYLTANGLSPGGSGYNVCT